MNLKNGLTFSEITAEELPLALEIYNYYIQHSTATFRTEALTLAEFQTFLFVGHPLYGSYLIRDTALQIHGFCALTRYSPRQAYARTAEIMVYLRPTCTGQGVGQWAVKYLEQHAQEHAIRVLIAIVTGENQASLRLFEKLGYERCAHYKEVGEIEGRLLDVIAYQKILEQLLP